MFDNGMKVRLSTGIPAKRVLSRNYSAVNYANDVLNCAFVEIRSNIGEQRKWGHPFTERNYCQYFNRMSRSPLTKYTSRLRIGPQKFTTSHRENKF